MDKILILPDIHGRKFWKGAIEQYPRDKFPDLKIVFLGDYLDPYVSFDGISKEEAFVNFEDILEHINNDDRIIPLIGNHDWHYFVNLDSCRMDFARERDIERLFKDNLSKFRLTWVEEVNNIKYVFSHAGITQKWLDNIAIDARYEVDYWNSGGIDPHKDNRFKWISEMRLINETYNFELLEECLKHYNENFYSAPVSMISRERGGYNSYGSLIWADVHEHLYNEDIKDFYQIFGHTITYPDYKPKAFSISPMGHSWAMLDASKAFILNDKGEIREV